DRAPWLTLLAGLAVVRALRSLVPEAESVGLKWPNDILLTDAGAELVGWGTARKVGGILTELLPGSTETPTAVVGIGVNLAQDVADLPVPSATSLAVAGLPVPPAEELLDAVGRALRRLVSVWEEHAGDAQAAGLRDAVSADLLTLAARCRSTAPGRNRSTALLWRSTTTAASSCATPRAPPTWSSPETSTMCAPPVRRAVIRVRRHANLWL